MFPSLKRLWAVVLLLCCGQAMALGLGEIRLDSALNEPLRADIMLVSATPEELENLTVRMASQELFARYGLDRPAYLSTVEFRVIPSGRLDGNIVRVTSPEPITEPFLTFLVEASWSRGRLIREYTVLLDPPTFAPPSEPVTQAVQPPVRSQPADEGRIERPAPPPQPAPQPAQQPVEPPAATTAPAAAEPQPEPAPRPAEQPFDTTPPGDYQVRRGDTLWGIASRYLPDDRLTMNQKMVAIFEANPQAFDGNINRLQAGASLRIPSADEVFRITRAEAIAEVQRQNDAWQGAAPAPAPAAPRPSLELVPPDEDAFTDDGPAVAADPDPVVDDEPEAVDSDAVRITQIENLLADQRAGLVVIDDNELAALQRELAELRGEPIPEDLQPTPADGAEVTADDEVFADDPDAAVADDAAADDAAADDAAADAAAAQPDAAEPAPAPVARQPAEQSLVDRVIGFATSIWGLIGIAVLIVAAILVFFARRAVSGDQDDDATALWTQLDDDDLAAEADAGRTASMPAMHADETIVVEEAEESGRAPDAGAMTETMELPAESAAVSDASAPSEDTQTAERASLEDTFSSDTALNLDQSDPIAEADFHMAYGLYDQAADLVNGALAVEPERTDLVAKLCEIYFVWGNRDAFVDAAERFKSLLGDREDPEWDKTVIMGQQIAGDHELFSDAQGATKAVDLAFGDDADAGGLDVDFAAEGGGDDVIDLGAEDSGAADAAATNSALDFVFDEVDSGATGETEQMPKPEEDPLAGAFADAGDETDSLPAMEEPTAEMPTAEMPSVDEDASGAKSSAGDVTVEVQPVDDSTAEMPTVESSLEDTAESPTIEEPASDVDATGELPAIGEDEATKVASLDDDSGRDSTAEIDLDDLGLDLDGLDTDLDSTAETSALDIDELAETGRNEAIEDPDATGRVKALSEDASSDDAKELLEATGQTQILPEDFAVETGTGTGIERALSEDDGAASIGDDEATKVASLDDDDDGDFEFARTEALPDDAVQIGGGDTSSPNVDMDLDLDDLTAALESSADDDTVNQAGEEATLEQPRPVANGDDSPTEALEPGEISDDLHDARTMTEVGTKLDLARAYVDMGDPNGARSILEEVLDEGDESQRQQAQQLLDSLPA